jgi:4a-hydroxytetrahydrobiopterin dehydratase
LYVVVPGLNHPGHSPGNWIRFGFARRAAPCYAGAMTSSRLSEDQIQDALGGLQGWSRDGEAIRRQFTFQSFPDAIAFATRLAFAAEAADHHPDMLISYKRVTLTYSTHSEGGLTPKDIDGARAADALATRLLRA